MTELGHAKVSGKLQITIPKKVQEELGGVENGQYILFYKDGKKIYICKGKVNPNE
ncbi:MAG: AbrB/MazE/SpoVT family DNA-binding domain-containing protein [Candidatus Thermoplasmatota archaeon]